VARRVAEACDDPGRVILAAVKAPIHQILYTPAQRYGQRSDNQGGDNQDHRVVFSEEAGQQVLATEHQREVHGQLARRGPARDQRALDNDISLPDRERSMANPDESGIERIRSPAIAA